MSDLFIQASESSDMPDFVSIGVADPSRSPNSTNFPSKFSPGGYPIWHKLSVCPEYLAYCKIYSDPLKRWEWMIKQYIRNCKHKIIFPFKVSGEQSKTDKAIFLLSLARRQLKAYFKSIDLFKKIRIFNTKRHYILKDKTFDLVIVANLLPIDDPTFYKWLLKHPPEPLFRATGKARQLQRLLYKTPDSSCVIHFNLAYMKHPQLTVNISFTTPLVIPHHNTVLTREQTEKYIEEKIWLPLVRTFRFDNNDNAGWRLF